MPVFGHGRKVSAHHIQQRHSNPPQVSSAAASAASLAFVNNAKSNPNLSAAAAAAALQKHPQAPTNPANAHTKRMQRRDSESSNGSSRPGLERRGSLTDRSLRSPSPGRDGRVPRLTDAPPVPRLPKNAANLDRTESGRQRAMSMEPPMRVSSPPPKVPGGRGMSLDRAGRAPLPPKSPAKKMPKVAEQMEAPQRSSVNFSRPMSPAPASPAASPQAQTGWFAGPRKSDETPRQSLDSLKPKSPLLSTSEASGIQVGLQGAADKPVKKKKKRLLSGGNQGSHLSKGSMEISGTAVEPLSPTTSAFSDSESTRMASYAESEGSRASFDSTSDASPVEPPRKFQTRAAAMLARQPSVVDEAPEFEEQSERANTGRKVEALSLKSPLDASRVAATSSPVPDTEHTLRAEPTTPAQNGGAVKRNTSISPARETHFSPKPEFLNGTKFAPPARSMSPQKSALKHSPSSSVRNASPDVRMGNTPSEAGDNVTKKKSARVSFDETPHVLTGLSTSRFASQSPTRSRTSQDSDLDDIMKPRPALPMFGSVRGRKTEDTDVKPSEHSNDHVVGSILAHDFAHKESASDAVSSRDVSRIVNDPTLPLPPDVLTVEGSGNLSDTESEYSVSHQDHSSPSAYGDSPAQGPQTIAQAVSAMQHSEPRSQSEVRTSASESHDAMPVKISHHIESVPTIAVLPATPAAEEEQEKELFMPGAFPNEDEAAAATTPVPQIVASSSPAEQPQGTLALLQSRDEEPESDSDNSSVWSDAEENLSDGPSGFASLNAIVDSPSTQAAPGLAFSRHAPAQADEVPPSPTAIQWERQKAYWSSLTEQTKKELENKAAAAEAHSQSEYEDSSDEETAVGQETRPATPPLKKTQAPKLESPIAFVPAPSVPRARKTAEPKLRSSMRGPQSTFDKSSVIAQPRKQPETKMRSSMRDSKMADDNGSPRIRQSLRTNQADAVEPRTSGEHRLRGSMRAAPEPMPRNRRTYSGGLDDSKWSAPKQQKTTLRKGAEPVPVPRPATSPAPRTTLRTSAAAAPPVSPLQRTGSADSASSFKRSRQRSSDAPVSLRRSMRGGPPAPASPPQRPTLPLEARKSSKFSIRSLSPMGRGEDTHHMRMSMRGAGSDTTVPTLRKQKEQKQSRLKSPTRLGFGRKKAEPAPSPKITPPKKYMSRFAADSDDEEVPPTSFVSRFADSDDELEPVRGIPRKGRDEDAESTDLEDSEGESGRVPVVPPVPRVEDVDSAHRAKTNVVKPGDMLKAGSLREGAGLGTSKHAPVSPVSPAATAERPGNAKRRLSWLGIGKSEKRASSVPPLPVMEKPKLQRRSTPTGLPVLPEDSTATTTTSWPLADERPNTSDGGGAGGFRRPKGGSRRNTAESGVTDGGSVRRRVGFNFENGEPVYSERTGRKKKFGVLRRMFGLND